jgi:hypothetical protein
MPRFEVQIVVLVDAKDEDDAADRTRKFLDPIEVTLESGIRGYAMLDDCVTLAHTQNPRT